MTDAVDPARSPRAASRSRPGACASSSIAARMHGTNEYPFLIDEGGLSVLPITSLTLGARGVLGASLVRTAAISTRCSAAAATIAAAPSCSRARPVPARRRSPRHFVDAACRRGERSLHFLFEESPPQMLRNMRSCGIDLAPWVDAGPAAVPRRSPVALRPRDASRDDAPRRRGSAPDGRVVDPMTNLMTVGTRIDVRAC